jgi:hypothetical protein
VENSHPSLLREIADKKTIDDDLKARVHAALKEFVKDVVPVKA